MNKTRMLRKDGAGYFMYRVAELQAELDNRNTSQARREELKKQIAELTEKMLATTDRV